MTKIKDVNDKENNKRIVKRNEAVGVSNKGTSTPGHCQEQKQRGKGLLDPGDIQKELYSVPCHCQGPSRPQVPLYL